MIYTLRYWREHMRRTVQFHAGLLAALATGCRTLLEIGPLPHLKALAVHSDAALTSRVYTSLRRRHNEWEDILETLGKLYVQGHTIDWHGFDRGHRRARLALPTYPFDRQRYWLTAGNADSSERIWQRAAKAALAQSNLVPIGLNVESFAAKWEALQRWAVAEVAQTLCSVGAFVEPGIRCDAQSLVARCGIFPVNTRLVNRWLCLLRDAGHLRAQGSQFESSTDFPDLDVAEAWQEVERRLNDDPYLLEYLRNCSKHLRGVLLGTTSPLETLFPGGSPDLARNLYEHSSGARYANLIVAAAVQAASSAASTHRRLQILELGAGTGATTAAILPMLSQDCIAYHFTDVSDVFLQRAKARFSSYPFVRYGLLDIESEEHIAYHRGSFDLVIAANVIHATRDLHATLSGIANLLAPGGTLVLLETTQQLAWHDVSTGLIEGWRKSEDDLRAGRTLLGVEEWTSALGNAGFKEIVSAPEPDSPVEAIGLHVILARNSGTRAEAPPAISIGADDTWVSNSATDTPISDPDADAFTAAFQEAPSAERRSLLIDLISNQIAQVLRLDSGTMPRKRDRLVDLGMDSLMAVELRNRLSTLLSVDDLPVTLIFDYPTPDAIAGYLLDRLQGQQQVENESPASPLAERGKLMTAQEVAGLSEEEVAALLRSRLA